MKYNNVNDYVMSKLVELWRNKLRFSIISDENLLETQNKFRSIIDEAEKMFGNTQEIKELKCDEFRMDINDSIKISYNNIWKNGDPMIKESDINSEVKSEFGKAHEYLAISILQILEEYPYSGKIDSSLTKAYIALQDTFRYIEKNFNLSEDELNFLKSSRIHYSNDIEIDYDGIYKNGKRILYDYKFNNLNDDVTENVTKCLDLQEEFNREADKILQDRPNIINQDWLYEVYIKLRVLLEELKETCLYNKRILKEVESYSYLVVDIDTKYYIRYDNVYKQELVKMFEGDE